jgi:hypothetical protein
MSNKNLSCSFCGAYASERFLFIAGPSCYICDACVEQAGRLIVEARLERSDGSVLIFQPDDKQPKRCRHDRTAL